MTTPTLAPEQRNALREAARAELARRDLGHFVHYTFLHYEWNWHHRVICDAVMRWLNGEYQNLALQCPPAHGKSELISRRLPAFLLAHNPQCRVISASYAATLAESLARDVRQIMAEPSYQGIYKGSAFAPNLKNSVDEFHTTRGGRYVCSGVGGGLIGKHYDYGIIDDPIKDAEEAFSETMRENLWQWYTRVWSNRKRSDKAKELVIMHRWHEDDLLARILKAQPGRWHVVNLRAIALEDEPPYRRKGDPLWPARFNLDFINAQRENNPYGFESLYQGAPIAEGGGMFKRQWFKYASKNGSPDLVSLKGEWRNIHTARRFITADLAVSEKDSADYTAIAMWASFPDGQLVLLDMIRERLEWPDVAPIIARCHERIGGDIWVEQMGTQKGLLADLRQHGLPVRPVRPDKDKQTRAAPAAAHCQAGKLWFLEGAYLPALEQEMLSFPAAKHDDQVDAIAYGVRIHNLLMAGSASQVR